MLGGCRRANAVKAIPASVARRRQKSQAIKNPKEINFAWGFSVLVVPRDGIEPPDTQQNLNPRAVWALAAREGAHCTTFLYEVPLLMPLKMNMLDV